MQLYNTISQLCDSRGINVTQMCKACGASRGSLTDLKSGRKQTLSAKTLQKIADYFGVSVDFLLTGEDTQKTETVSDLLADTKRRLGSATNDGAPLTDRDKQLMYDALDMLSTHFSNIRHD